MSIVIRLCIMELAKAFEGKVTLGCSLQLFAKSFLKAPLGSRQVTYSAATIITSTHKSSVCINRRH